MKNIYYSKLIVCLLFGFVFISCDQDDSLEDTPLENTTKAEIVEESITVSEGEIPTFNLIQEDLVQNVVDNWEAIFVFPEVSGQVGVRVVGGTATEGEDYTFNLFTIQDFSPFLLQDGYYLGYDASTSLEHNISGIIDIIDDGIAEGTETIELQFYPIALGYIIIDDTLTININD
ncbi:hypothetical protein DFQ05_0071 [Winogradskyella wandonensis]|uniref:Uncharacterized protein n=1 Tax=Winogradskyella wandonensis TaxID=1442586 RepID=A0A4R1KV44_9FLAO|nr:hypothetical protein [Winogradskyella wandonensis]TCK68563.1 hypothetical protein DFQ05_0071 [Winogradskyella wandonensis]